jgi:imidazoleglycerol phosphate dehydratase HisB
MDAHDATEQLPVQLGGALNHASPDGRRIRRFHSTPSTPTDLGP